MFRALAASGTGWLGGLKVGLSLWLLLGLTPPRAAAYCRESLLSQSQGPCDEAPGVPFLFWQRPCLTLRLNDQLFAHMPLLSEPEVRAALRDSFATWAEVECSGKRPFLVEQARELTSTSRSELLLDGQNESVVLARSAFEWTSLADHDPSALGLTLLWFDRRNGEILDVDIELNAGTGRFADCAATACQSDMVDLRNTVTHEAGHLLGLGHSNVPNSTMEARTDTESEIHKRELSEDDREGYCSLDLPEPDCVGIACTCPPPRPLSERNVGPLRGGCQSCMTAPRPGHFGWFIAAMVVLWLSLRRNIRRPQLP